MVQMAVRDGTRLECAIKFFLTTAAFQEEASLYSKGSYSQSRTFAQFLPQVNSYEKWNAKFEITQTASVEQCQL